MHEGIEDGDAFPRVLIKNEHLHVMYQESRVQRRMLSPRSDASIASLVRTATQVLLLYLMEVVARRTRGVLVGVLVSVPV